MANKNADELYQQAMNEMNGGDCKNAAKDFESAVKLDPDKKDAYYWIGECHNRLQDYKKARLYYEKGLKLDPENPDLYNGIGTSFYYENNFDDAPIYYYKALEKNKNFHFAWYNLSLIERKKGNFDKEREFLDKCISIAPGYIDALNARGNIYYNRSEYDKAGELYKKVLIIDPNYKYALYNLGLIEEMNSNFHKAKDYYEKSLKSDPDYKQAQDSLKDIKKRILESGESLDEEEGASSESIVERLGRNLNELAKQGKLSEVIGREKEMTAVMEVLYKRFKNNPILIGHPGVGKTVIVEGLAQKIVAGTVPEFFKNKQIIELNIGQIVAGTKYRGELESKMNAILNEAKKNENWIIFIDEIHTILGAGTTEDSALGIDEMLKPALARGEFVCIGATTVEEYRKYFEKDPALARRFYPLMVEEPSIADTKAILRRMKIKASEYYKLDITDAITDEIVELASKHVKNRFFPDKAIDVMEKTCSRVSLKGGKSIESRDIREIVTEMTGVQFSGDKDGEFDKLLHLEDELRKMVFGQDEAIDALANILRATKRRLDAHPERPDGVFLFTGPTGVGKTYLAKCLAKVLYDNPAKLLRLDMSEFMEKFSVTRLIGSPPGYIGHDETPALTGMIEENPSSILLLDEIEKAHPDVVKIFLQVFDEGFVTDSRSKRVYFSDVTIIMTGNVLQEIPKTMGFAPAEGGSRRDKAAETDAIVDALSRDFPKEFLNRIDEIIIFKPLSKNEIKRILTDDLFVTTKQRFAQEGIVLEFDESVVGTVTDAGYSPELGARNLSRVFDRMVMSPLVRYVFEQTSLNGSKLRIRFENDELKIERN